MASKSKDWNPCEIIGRYWVVANKRPWLSTASNGLGLEFIHPDEGARPPELVGCSSSPNQADNPSNANKTKRP